MFGQLALLVFSCALAVSLILWGLLRLTLWLGSRGKGKKPNGETRDLGGRVFMVIIKTASHGSTIVESDLIQALVDAGAKVLYSAVNIEHDLTFGSKCERCPEGVLLIIGTVLDSPNNFGIELVLDARIRDKEGNVLAAIVHGVPKDAHNLRETSLNLSKEVVQKVIERLQKATLAAA
jgi:hypothetical protein